MTFARRCLLMLGGSACALSAGAVRAADAPVSEYAIKAAILLQTTRFVEWPADAFPAPDAPLVVGVLGQDPFGPLLEQTFKGETTRGRPIQVRRFASFADLEPCHVLCVCVSEEERWPDIRKRLGEGDFATRVPMTVSDIPTFAEKGGVLQLTLQEKKVHLHVNVDAAARARLKVSSQLLKLAAIVRDKAPE
jgi:hypothetical protein